MLKTKLKVEFWVKIFFTELVFLAALSGIGWIFAGSTGAEIGILAGLAFSVALGVFSERAMIRWHRAKPNCNPALSHTVQWIVFTQKLAHTPKLFLIPDPAPWALVVKSFFSQNGCLLLSQGLLNRLPENGLRDALLINLRRLSEPELPLKCACSFLLMLLLKLAPKDLVHCWLRGQKPNQINPFTILHFLLIFPFIPFFFRLSRQHYDWNGALAQIQKWQTFQPHGIYVPGAEALLWPPPSYLDLVSRL